MQGRNRDGDVENGCVDSEGREVGGGDKLWEKHQPTYTTAVKHQVGNGGMEVRERPKRDGMYIYTQLSHFIIQQKLTTL